MMHHRNISSSFRVPMAWAVVLCLFLPGMAVAKPDGNGRPKDPAPVDSPPMTLEQESYFFRVPGENTCLGEDDELEWLAAGSLAPGERFTFVPQVGACNRHPAAITVVASWGSGSLTLESEVPDIDYTSWDAEQFGRHIQAPIVGNRAQLCMFPAFTTDGVKYTVTLTNDSSETVHDIRLHGRHENDWAIFYYPRCLNADADGDGWNDSLEHSMASLVYPNGYIDGVLQPDILWGSNYLRDRAQTPFPNDEIDSYPPDFNDDGRVDELDLAKIEGQLGAGNGIPLEQVSPNPGELWFHENTLPWRRYDLDGDGFVGNEDWSIVHQIMGEPVPLNKDVISPSARITYPLDGDTVPRGDYVLIRSHVWDNAALARVDYLVNGKIICSQTEPVPSFGFTSPLYSCWWQVPKRSTTYRLEVRAYDTAGNVNVNQPVLISSM
jgi:hypothetical protein